MSAKGSVYLVTGCTTGLGYHCVSALARSAKADHNSISAIILACRRPNQAEKVADEIAEKEGVDRSLLVVLKESLDLFDLGSVRAYATAVKAYLEVSGLGKLDVLVNNAGIGGGSDYVKNSSGFERIFVTNHLGPFLLTFLLLPVITTRVVNVASEAHDPKETPSVPDPSVSWPTTSDEYDKYFAVGEALSGDDDFTAGMRRYSRSKLFNILFTNELARRCSNDLPFGVEEEVSSKISSLNKPDLCALPNANALRSVSFNPGLMFDTAFIAGQPLDEIPEWAAGVMHLVRKASDSGANLAAISTGEILGDATATYFSDRDPKSSSEFSRMVETIVIRQKELWDHSVRWAGVTSEELKNSGF